MTINAGEVLLVLHAAWDAISRRRLADADAVCTITIWDTDGTTVLVDEDTMTYSAELVFDDGEVGGWYYRWTTPAPDPGTFTARVRITGAGISAWEFKTLRTRRNKRT